MKLRNWVIRSGTEWLVSDTGYRDPLDILCEIERRKEVVEMLGDVSEVLSPRDIRVLYMYIKGSKQIDIEAKTGIGSGNTMRNIDRIANKIFKAVKVFQCYHHVVSKESALEADVPRVKIGWALKSAQKAYKGSHWGTEYRRKAWKTKTSCKVVEYFEKCFGDSETRCTLCSIHNCTRRKTQC